MSVELEPSELGFRRPFTQEVTQVLRLKNPNSDPVAFKVKTTAPKQYCVRPNSGRIEPGEDVEVQVLLQAMKEDPALDARCRDKFLVQSVGITRDQDNGNFTTIWSNIEKTAKDSIKERKIRVTFLPAHDPEYAAQQSPATMNHANDDAPPAYGSPSPSFGSPAVHDARSTDNTPAREAQGGLVASVRNTAASAAAAVLPAGDGDLAAQLKAAKAKIAELQESTLRQRKTNAASQDTRDGSTTGNVALQNQSAQGVPVQIVAALCLLSFLMAYFFF